MTENKRTFDRYQKKAIEAEKNAVVSAGAGSGKTTVLSERFAQLVTKKKLNVEQILTLTFTKKATVEMSARIYKVLKERAPEKAADFFKANIKTLDSYCSSVAKTGCHLYGITPDFKQDDEEIKRQVYNMALPFILEHRDNDAIKTLVKTESFDIIAQELFVEPVLQNSTVAQPVDFDICIKKQHEEIIDAWKQNSLAADNAVNRLIDAFNRFEGNRGTKTYTVLLEKLGNIESLPEVPQLSAQEIDSSDCSRIEEYTSFIKSLADIRSPSGGGVEEIKEYISALKETSPVLVSIVNYVWGYRITKGLLPLLKEFQDKVNRLKRTSAVLTFQDVSSLATCILRDYPELRQIEKEKYKAIMIDEFQDNNTMQKDMLFMLAEKTELHRKGVPSVDDLCPDKLFFVGDEKQSIYRFRGADVSVFRALSKDFAGGNLNMSTNYRSHKALIASFNTIFGGEAYPPAGTAAESGTEKITEQLKEYRPAVFYTEKAEKSLLAQGTAVPDYEAVYHSVKLPESLPDGNAGKEHCADEYAPRVHIALYDKSQEAEKNRLIEEEAEAEWVAQKIRSLINGITEENPVQSQNRPASCVKKTTPGSIAILLKNYSLQPLYERTLLSHGIPYNTETVTGFFSDGPVNDIFAMLRICVYRKDTLSYAQVLRSPWVNLSTDETNTILTLEEPPFSSEPEGILCPQSVARYRHAGAFFEELKDYSKNNSLTQTVSKLWYESGYRYETVWNTTVGLYAKMYDLIFELARKSEQQNMSLSSFVDSVREYQNQAQKLEGMDIPLEQTSGVHILSIHKSKGLEYPVVFLCGTHKGGNREKNDKIVYASKEYGITINTPPCSSFPEEKTNYFFKKVSELSKAQSYAELRRLVYVAMTRAKDELYITNGKYSYIEDAEKKYSPGGTGALETIFQVISPAVTFYFESTQKNKGPFTLEYINPYIRNSEQSEKGTRNNAEAKIRLLQEIDSGGFYRTADVIPQETAECKYISPSQLHFPDDGMLVNGKHGEVDPEAPYQEINRLVESSIPEDGGEPAFSFTNFGTIAHRYLEAAIKGIPPQISNRDTAGLAENKKNLETVKSVCVEMADNFIKSEIGRQAAAADWLKTEYPFKSCSGRKIIKGTVDLVFRGKDGRYTVVDYKTNQTVRPEIYVLQLSCYRQAVSRILGIQNPKEIRCCLYYLRFNRTEDISALCDDVDITTEAS